MKGPVLLCVGLGGQLRQALSSAKEEARTFSRLLFMKRLLNRYRVSVCHQLVEGVSEHAPTPRPLPTMGTEAGSGSTLPSTLAVMNWERPWGREGFQGRKTKGEMGRPRAESGPPGVGGWPQASWQEFCFSFVAVV